MGQYAHGFRFDVLYSSITGLSRRDIINGVEHGFGKLPGGCHIQLEKQARDKILKSLRDALNQNWRRLQTERRSCSYCSLHSLQKPSVPGFLHDQQLELSDIYSSKGGILDQQFRLDQPHESSRHHHHRNPGTGGNLQPTSWQSLPTLRGNCLNWDVIWNRGNSASSNCRQILLMEY